MPSKATECSDICIVGGGMVGLACACLLAKSLPHKQIVVVEKFAAPTAAKVLYQPSFDGRSSAISAGSVDILNDLGIWSSLVERAQPIHEVFTTDRGHIGAVAYESRDNHDSALGYVVENAWFGQQLFACLASFDNIELRDNTQVEAVTFQRHTAQLQLSPTNSKASERLAHHCQLLVLADGADSRLAQDLGIACDIFDYQQQALVANVCFDQPHRGRAFECFTESGPLALLPLPPLGSQGASWQNCSALVWTHSQQTVGAALHCDESRFLAHLQRAFGYRLGHFTQASERQAYGLTLRTAKEQVRSKLVLLGNAAHFLHPVAGQGFNLALRDAFALVQTLASAAADVPLGDLGLLQSYVAKQLHDQQLTVGLSHNFNRLFASSDCGARVLRTSGLLMLNMFEPLRQGFFKQMMGTAVGVHSRPLKRNL